ncbi:hypothetical protein [Streptosporangium sp. NPDC000396]|uniref:hypothetical protein n=1 Tax=Streptosporangium sp. NPDC000396 TaxID=3366185 RepID=UPI0036B4D663
MDRVFGRGKAADAIAARLAGGKLPNAPIRYFSHCISLAGKEGLIQYVTADDRAVQAVLIGRLAAVYKELVCKGAVGGVANPMLGLPTRRRRLSGPRRARTSRRWRRARSEAGALDARAPESRPGSCGSTSTPSPDERRWRP